jgi:transposase
MSRFLEYSPDQAYLLPPSVKDELGADHLSFFLHRVVERLDLSEFERAYGEEGGAVYAPALMLKVWLYAYALGITSARRLERRIVEDLALRYLAGGQRPDNWALSAFRRRHGRALNDVFTQVVEMARGLGLGKLGMVALDSTRIRASASGERIDTEPRLRGERAKIRRQIRRWQKGVRDGRSGRRRGDQSGSGETGRKAGGITPAAGAVTQERRSEVVAAGRGGAISAGAGRICAGLHGGDGGERGSSDCGPAGDVEPL